MEREQIEQELGKIAQRNRRVEADKAWETSKTRRLFIALATYLVAAAWLAMIHDSHPFLKALIPAIGYVLSTMSLPLVKNWWVNKWRG